VGVGDVRNLTWWDRKPLDYPNWGVYAWEHYEYHWVAKDTYSVKELVTFRSIYHPKMGAAKGETLPLNWMVMCCG
jgi:hypothetical protein